jgi:hypothetical protein
VTLGRCGERAYAPLPALEKEAKPMSRMRTMLLLSAVALVTVVMLAMSGMAWAQQQGGEPQATTTATGGDTTTAGQGSSTAAPVAPSAHGGLKVKAINPKPGSKTNDRTPLIKAKVTDNNGTVKKSGIKLYLDGNKINNFTYKSGKGLVEYTPNNDLSIGKHSVKVVAKDNKGHKDREKWSFHVQS